MLKLIEKLCNICIFSLLKHINQNTDEDIKFFFQFEYSMTG